MSFLKRLFSEPKPAERRQAARRASPNFEVSHFSGESVRVDPIGDISASGVYVLTENRWLAGSTVPLMLHPKSEFSPSERRHVTLHATAVRCGSDGVGFSFIPPGELDAESWVDLMESSVNEQAPDDLVGQFRMAEAVAFLSAIAPSTTAGVRRLVRGGLNNHHITNVVEIALKAKGMLAGGDHPEGLHAHEQVVLHVLEHGSWADDDEVQRLWAGLLVASCMPEPADESNLFLVDLFSQLAPIHVRIFAAACRRVTKAVAAEGKVVAEPLLFSQEEIMKASGSRDLVRIERDLFHLNSLGLIESGEKAKSMAVLERAVVTPTSLGLELYARCNGYRGSLPEFYAVAPAASHAG